MNGQQPSSSNAFRRSYSGSRPVTPKGKGKGKGKRRRGGPGPVAPTTGCGRENSGQPASGGRRFGLGNITERGARPILSLHGTKEPHRGMEEPGSGQRPPPGNTTRRQVAFAQEAGTKQPKTGTVSWYRGRDDNYFRVVGNKSRTKAEERGNSTNKVLGPSVPPAQKGPPKGAGHHRPERI